MKLIFYKNNRIDGKHEKSVDEIIKDFNATEESRLDMPFERLILNFMSESYGSFDVLTDDQWNELYKARRTYLV